MQRRRRPCATVISVILLLGATMVSAQRQSRAGFGVPGFIRGYSQNEPPNTEFVIARWHYSSGWGGGGWAHDYPAAEQHFLQVMKEATGINVDRLSYRIVELGSPEIFRYPFAYVSEPGEMRLTEAEVENLREYIDRGGFVMIDDFGGQGQGPQEFENFRRNLTRAFPDRALFGLDDRHGLLNTFYKIDSIQTVHPMTGVKSIFYGYPDDRGGLAMVVCYANDVGDYWEFIDEPMYPVKPSAEALKLGINFVMYALTH